MIPAFEGAAPGAPGDEPFCRTVSGLVEEARKPEPFAGATSAKAVGLISGGQGDCRALDGRVTCGIAFAYASAAETSKADQARLDALGTSLPDVLDACLTGPTPMIAPVGSWKVSRESTDEAGQATMAITWTDDTQLAVRMERWQASDQRRFVSGGLTIEIGRPPSPPPEEPRDTGM